MIRPSPFIQVAMAVSDDTSKLRPNLAKLCNPGITALAIACWDHDAANRPTFGRVLGSLDSMLPTVIEELRDARLYDSTASPLSTLSGYFKGMFKT